jgi:[protein-PII] uridylyltransferase
VEWLVRYHLLMSDMAQKRDIGDPRTVRDFAKAVKTRKRLDLLTVLTVCDIRGVGPGTWNNWKAMLLRQLHKQTAEALEGGLESVNRENREDEAKRALRERLSDWPGRRSAGRDRAPLRALLAGPVDRHACGLCPPAARPGDDEIRIDLHPDPDRDATRACFRAGRPSRHLLASCRGAGAGRRQRGDARTYTSKDGYATPSSGCRTSRATPTRSPACPACAR